MSSQGHPGPTQQQWSRGSAAPKGEACLEVCSYRAPLFRTGGRWRGCESDADVPGPCFSSSINRGTVMAGFVLLSCSSHYGPQTAVTGFEAASTCTLLRDPLSRGGSATRLGGAQGSSGIHSPWESKSPGVGLDTPSLLSQALVTWLTNREGRTRYSYQ